LHLGWSVVSKWIGAGFALGLAGAGAAAYVSTPTAAVAVVASATAARPASILPMTAAEARPVAPVAPPLPSVAEAAPLHPLPDKSTAPPSAEAPSSRPTLDEELRLITAAKREIDAGRPHLARVWLDEHRQRFTGGVFSLERDALLILVRCSQSKNPALARDFALQHPGAPMLAQLSRSCGVESAPASVAPRPHEDFSEPTNALQVPGKPIKE